MLQCPVCNSAGSDLTINEVWWNKFKNLRPPIVPWPAIVSFFAVDLFPLKRPCFVSSGLHLTVFPNQMKIAVIALYRLFARISPD